MALVLLSSCGGDVVPASDDASIAVHACDVMVTPDVGSLVVDAHPYDVTPIESGSAPVNASSCRPWAMSLKRWGNRAHPTGSIAASRSARRAVARKERGAVPRVRPNGRFLNGLHDLDPRHDPLGLREAVRPRRRQPPPHEAHANILRNPCELLVHGLGMLRALGPGETRVDPHAEDRSKLTASFVAHPERADPVDVDRAVPRDPQDVEPQNDLVRQRTRWLLGSRTHGPTTPVEAFSLKESARL